MANPEISDNISQVTGSEHFSCFKFDINLEMQYSSSKMS